MPHGIVVSFTVNFEFWLGGIYNTSMSPPQWVDYMTLEPLTYLPWNTAESQPNMGTDEIQLGNKVDKLTGWHDYTVGRSEPNYMCQIHL